MASGEVVGVVQREMPPDANAATLDTRAGGSTPGEVVIVHDFDAATDEYLDYMVQLQGYDGGGLTLSIRWSASSATTNECVWRAAVRRVADDAEDIDASHTYVYNSVDATTASASGEVDYADITFTDGADMDSWADGEVAILRIGRFASTLNDDMTGDAELWGFVLKET